MSLSSGCGGVSKVQNLKLEKLSRALQQDCELSLIFPEENFSPSPLLLLDTTPETQLDNMAVKVH